MATTPNGLYYPALSDAPNGAAQMQQLAQSADHLVIGSYATATARSAAVTAPNTGDITYRADGNVYEQWTGSAWKAVFAPGSVARVGITAASSSISSPTTAGVQTWANFGTVTVPTWATQCTASYTITGISSPASLGNTKVALQIGTAGGNLVRLMETVSNGRFYHTYHDVITGLGSLSGTQNVNLTASWVAGSAYVIDTNSSISTIVTFLP